MPNLNKNEYGQVVSVDFGEDVSTATAYKFILEPKLGTELEKLAVDGVVLGTINLDVGDETYLANEYINYTIKKDDLDYAGQWRMRGEATLSATNKVISDYIRFTVLE